MQFKDQNALDDSEEYLKRIYQITEYPFKIQALSEYYKYHSDVPRIFIAKICDTMNKYHDKRRKIEYLRIKKMLNLSTSLSPSESEKSNEESKKEHQEINLSQQKKNERILDNLNFTSQNSIQPKEAEHRKTEKSLGEILNQISFTSKEPEYSSHINMALQQIRDPELTEQSTNLRNNNQSRESIEVSGLSQIENDAANTQPPPSKFATTNTHSPPGRNSANGPSDNYYSSSHQTNAPASSQAGKDARNTQKSATKPL